MTNILQKILWVWQAPQHLLALALIFFFKKTGKYIKQTEQKVSGQLVRLITITGTGLGVSLGQYIIATNPTEVTINHEKGHTIQSFITGPLYLLIIGLPSLFANNIWDRLFHRDWPHNKRLKWYYNRYPEKSADKFGGVHRIYESL